MYNVEAAFLNVNPGSKMYLKIPDKMVELGFITREEQKQWAILLANNMYGNVDAALRFFEKYSGILIEQMGFSQNRADPCIFFKRNDNKQLMMVISTHMDDSLIGGRKQQVQAFYSEFSKHLKIEVLGKLKKHLGVWWEWISDPDSGEIYLKATMQKMLKEIKEAYADATGQTPKPWAMPACPGESLTKATEEEDEVKSTQYRSIVGKLMYYMTKVAPDISNVVRELAGQMIKPTAKHWKALDRAVGYVLHEPYQGLVLKKPKNLRPYIYSDADYTSDKQDRKSISGRISMLGSMIVGWSSKKQQTVSLSSCESE